jgi:hypothetical protein
MKFLFGSLKSKDVTVYVMFYVVFLLTVVNRNFTSTTHSCLHHFHFITQNRPVFLQLDKTTQVVKLTYNQPDTCDVGDR